MDMQGLEFPGTLPSVTGRDNSLADLDALDVDNLLSAWRLAGPCMHAVHVRDADNGAGRQAPAASAGPGSSSPLRK